MKKILAVLVAAYASTTLAAVGGSAHDLTAQQAEHGTRNYGTAISAATTTCAYCHTPHGANTAATFATAPLWNRTFNAGNPVWTMYAGAVNGTIDTAPNSASATCLSCHEGSATIGLTFTGGATNLNQTITNSTMVAGVGNLRTGADLSNDHPVSITYPAAATPGFADAAGNLVGALPLYSNKVECGSCHDPHDTTVGKFLRAGGAALCQTCHDTK